MLRFAHTARSAAFLLAALLASAVSAQTDPFPPAVTARLAQASMREYLDLLAIPNDAIVPADIQKNTAWLERAFQQRGFITRQLANDGPGSSTGGAGNKPMLFAEWPKKVAGAKTVL